ncbi:MAG TPA: type 1 glutamine amidotransferase [Phycisphaerales bacterium]|nr:type 1 glutamine amidotransferase [Phycisphaerales bacterium]
MAILVLQHDSDGSLGRLGACLRDHGQACDVRRLWLPESPGNPHVPTDFDNVDAVISLGGRANVGDHTPWMAREIAFLKEAHERRLPLVGICLGAQMIAKALGGEVGPMADAAGHQITECGMATVRQHPIANTDIVLAGVPWTTPQMHAHGHEIKTPPPGATVLQFSDKCRVQSFRIGLRTYGFQYHFEWDWPMIEGFLWAMGRAEMLDTPWGIADTHAAIADAKAGYPEFARVGDRMCVNLAEYLLPVGRRILA